MPLLPVLVLLSILCPALADAAPLFCYWVENTPNTTRARALSEVGRLHDVTEGKQTTPAQAVKSLERTEPSGGPIAPELMTRLRTLATEAATGPYRDTPRGHKVWMRPHIVAACLVSLHGQSAVPMTLLECHNDRRINISAAALELISHLTGLIGPPQSQSPEVTSIIRNLRDCY